MNIQDLIGQKLTAVQEPTVDLENDEMRLVFGDGILTITATDHHGEGALRYDTMEKTPACQERATWKQCGKRLVYTMTISPDSRIVEHLGAVKLRGDGRWDWWRWESDFYEWPTGQGVEETEEEAKARVLEGWE